MCGLVYTWQCFKTHCFFSILSGEVDNSSVLAKTENVTTHTQISVHCLTKKSPDSPALAQKYSPVLQLT
jgi:hypothetical protein